ncbi:glycosyltransferase family 2 protein [Ancylobacter radicis]|uniref:Glycosyltransferase family 2 protein n=1 Tax=Ancylobacter radicis TaxID=2836179 RepID=A0ABS5RC22_9HYPH|nr:glycosyltransferase family 2 protein [Ancylobacter radicis]MBS9479216.1 glycosyltransferase family 2 protein [Ancylobacter radicis]
MRISVVIPAYNEAGNITRLVVETLAVLPESLLGEIVVVDDCSDDGTGAELRALADPRLRVLRHGRRAGQSAALRNGIRAAACPVIVTMDGDGQNDPADIAALVRRLASAEGGAPALVGGVRAKRRAVGSRRLASRFANGLRGALLADECPDTGCGIKAFRRAAFLDLPYFSTMHRYLPALFLSYGHKVAYVPVNDRPRVAGQSKYTNLGRALVGLYDLFGVVWLRRRSVLPPVSEESRPALGLRTARGVEAGIAGAASNVETPAFGEAPAVRMAAAVSSPAH